MNNNANVNTNLNTQGQMQGQLQGQMQGQGQGQNQTATGGNSSAQGGNANANNTNSVNNSVNVAAQERNPVSSATAPGLTSANGSCMGSTSVGAQGVGFGISVGGTWTDGDCDRRYDSIRLQEMGMHKAAVLMMCGKASVAKVMKDAGTPCPTDKTEVAVAPAPVVTTAKSSSSSSCSYKGNDPIVMARSGC